MAGGQAGGRCRGCKVKREDAKQPHTFGLRLELVAELRHAVGRGLCSSRYGKGAEAESIEWSLGARRPCTARFGGAQVGIHDPQT
jgi:hypothetical protein